MSAIIHPDHMPKYTLAGDIAAFGWGQTLDGTGLVVWNGDWHQIYPRVSTVIFDNGAISINEWGQISTNDGDGWAGPDGALYPDYSETPAIDHSVSLKGLSSDYGWGPTLDGSGMVVWKGDWHQIVDPGTTVNFDDGSVAIGLDLKISVSLPGMTDVDTTDDTLPGSPSDYGWGPTLDGSGMVVWKGDWFQIFERGSTVTFSDDSRELVADTYGTIILREPGASYPGAVDLPGVNMADFSYTLSDDLDTWQLGDGSSSRAIKVGQVFRFDDVTIKVGADGGFTTEYGAPVQAPVTHFGIDGSSGDFGWGPTEDGKGLVIWKGENFHISSAVLNSPSTTAP